MELTGRIAVRAGHFVSRPAAHRRVRSAARSWRLSMLRPHDRSDITGGPAASRRRCALGAAVHRDAEHADIGRVGGNLSQRARGRVRVPSPRFRRPFSACGPVDVVSRRRSGVRCGSRRGNPYEYDYRRCFYDRRLHFAHDRLSRGAFCRGRGGSGAPPARVLAGKRAWRGASAGESPCVRL